jgi:hypothetical protein
VGHMGDLARWFSPDDPGYKHIIPLPVFYTGYSANHLADEKHRHRISWLQEHQSGMIKALQYPDFLEPNLRKRTDQHNSITLAAELFNGDKKVKRFLVMAVSLSLEPVSGFHQITTIFPAAWTDFYYSSGILKMKYKQVK